MAKHNEVGVIGEMVAVEYLESKGHTIVERNYRRKYGELDVVSRQGSTVHFVEVKTVSRETVGNGVLGEHLRPEENMHKGKIARLLRVLQVYVAKNEVSDWQFDVVAIYLDSKTNTARVRYLENIILEP